LFYYSFAAWPLLAFGAANSNEKYYSIGQPTNEEQYYVELINRARSDPKAEGARLAATTDGDVLDSYKYFSVNLAQMKSEFATLSAMPPLAINAELMACARGHSKDMFDKQFQGHTGSNGSTIGGRATKAGYNWSSIAENVYSYAETVWHGHAGFQVDWGEGDGGMQPARGHRANIHHSQYREVGVGVVLGTNGAVGPQVVTQNFGKSRSNTAFITGVAYYDIDGNGFYSPGEGIGNLTVTVSGAKMKSITAASGGYAVPVPTTKATRKVDFSGNGLNFSTNALISGGKNVKLDFKPAYQAPKVSGPATIPAGKKTDFSFTPVKGAGAHDWKWTQETPAAKDAAENLTLGKSHSAGGYAMLSTQVKNSGSACYRFAQPQLNRDETFTYHSVFLPGKNAAISFQSRLGWASKTQFAKIQVSSDEGTTWQDIYSQAGSGTSGEKLFQARTASLAAYAGVPLRIRLNYTMTKGTSAYYQTDHSTGWFVDEIIFTNMGELSAPTIKRISKGNTFSFSPLNKGIYHLSVRAVMSGTPWAFGPTTKVVAGN
jgi:uncharacterized protein YkwD